MEGEECTVTTNTDAVNRMIADKTGAVGDILYSLSGLDFLDDIKNTVKLLAGQFVNGFFKAL